VDHCTISVGVEPPTTTDALVVIGEGEDLVLVRAIRRDDEIVRVSNQLVKKVH